MAERKAIFVTGGGSGIGRAIAMLFAERGWFVGLGDVDPAGMAETVRIIGDGFTFTHQFDVRDRAAWDGALAAFAAAAGGRIDVLVNNAGVPLGGTLADNSTAEIERTLDINLKGVIFGAQAALSYLSDTAPGSCLLNTASAAGVYGTAGASVYSATKFGVRGLTEALDAELHAMGIRVRSLCPSFIDTPLLDHAPNARSNQDIRTRVREGGLEITPVADVAQAAWDAVHGNRLHTLVGQTARRVAFASRWLPGKMRGIARARARDLS